MKKDAKDSDTDRRCKDNDFSDNCDDYYCGDCTEE